MESILPISSEMLEFLTGCTNVIVIFTIHDIEWSNTLDECRPSDKHPIMATIYHCSVSTMNMGTV